MTDSPSRVAVVSPLDVVASGLAAMLAHHPDEVLVVDLSTGFGADDPDVILYDAIGLHEGNGADLEFFVQETTAAVLVVSQDLRPDLASRALARGADGFFSLGVDDDQLLAASGFADLAERAPDSVLYSDGVRTRFGMPQPVRGR